MKKIARCVIVVSMILCIGGMAFASGEKEASKPAEPVELLVWTSIVPGAGQDRFDAFTEITAEFEKKFPNIKIKHEWFNFEQHSTTVKMAVQGGTGPDVLSSQVGADAQDRYFRNGQIIDLAPMAVKYKWLDKFEEIMNRVESIRLSKVVLSALARRRTFVRVVRPRRMGTMLAFGKRYCKNGICTSMACSSRCGMSFW